MKKLRILLPALAFMFAMTAAFALAQQSLFYDANEAAVGGGTLGTVTAPTDTDATPCSVRSDGSICFIGAEWAFDTSAHAVTNAGGTTNTSATGLERYIP